MYIGIVRKNTIIIPASSQQPISVFAIATDIKKKNKKRPNVFAINKCDTFRNLIAILITIAIASIAAMNANTNTKGKLSVHKYSFNCSILFLFKFYIFLNQRYENKHRLRRNPAQPIKKGYSLHFFIWTQYYLFIFIGNLFAIDEFQHLRHIAFVCIQLLKAMHIIWHNLYPPIICLMNHEIQ